MINTEVEALVRSGWQPQVGGCSECWLLLSDDCTLLLVAVVHSNCLQFTAIACCTLLRTLVALPASSALCLFSFNLASAAANSASSLQNNWADKSKYVQSQAIAEKPFLKPFPQILFIFFLFLTKILFRFSSENRYLCGGSDGFGSECMESKSNYAIGYWEDCQAGIIPFLIICNPTPQKNIARMRNCPDVTILREVIQKKNVPFSSLLLLRGPATPPPP